MTSDYQPQAETPVNPTQEQPTVDVNARASGATIGEATDKLVEKVESKSGPEDEEEDEEEDDDDDEDEDEDED